MIGIDTNVLLRYLTQDDPDQSARAERFIDSLTPEAPGFVSLVTLSELYWVLSQSYKLPKDEVLDILKDLVSFISIEFEKRALVLEALHRYAIGKAGLSDYLIAFTNQQAGCDYTVTFDLKAEKDRLMAELA